MPHDEGKMVIGIGLPGWAALSESWKQTIVISGVIAVSCWSIERTLTKILDYLSERDYDRAHPRIHLDD
jgi:hypothetical protein